jgi:hypothetical protein
MNKGANSIDSSDNYELNKIIDRIILFKRAFMYLLYRLANKQVKSGNKTMIFSIDELDKLMG